MMTAETIVGTCLGGQHGNEVAVRKDDRFRRAVESDRLWRPAFAALFVVRPLMNGIGADRFAVLTLGWVLIGYFTVLHLGLGMALTNLVSERVGARNTCDLAGIVAPALVIMVMVGAIKPPAWRPSDNHRVISISRLRRHQGQERDLQCNRVKHKTPKTIAGPFKTKEEAQQAKEKECATGGTTKEKEPGLLEKVKEKATEKAKAQEEKTKQTVKEKEEKANKRLRRRKRRLNRRLKKRKRKRNRRPRKRKKRPKTRSSKLQILRRQALKKPSKSDNAASKQLN